MGSDMNEGKFPKKIAGMIEASKSVKTSERRLWNLTARFLEGRQWLSYDRRTSEHVTSRLSGEGQTRVTINLLINMYRNVLSRLALSYPSIAVLPPSPSNEDIIKAKACEMALRYYWQADEMKPKLQNLVQMLLQFGTGALYSFYDPAKKRVSTEVYRPHDIFFEPAVIDPSDSQWIALRRFVTKAALKKAFPKDKKEIEEAAGPTDDTYGVVSTGSSMAPPKNRVELFEIHWRDGRHAIVLGSHYLHKGMRGMEEFPIQIVRYTEVDRRLWGISFLAPLLDLQLLYNRARSQMIQNVELMGNPKWLIPKTAGVASNSITSRAGEKIYYNAASPRPEQVMPAPLPEYVTQNIVRIQSEMMDVSGVHSVTLGKRAVGITSGKGMDVLTERDTSQLQITQEYIERAVARTARCALALMQKHYTEPRMMAMFDQYGKPVYNAIKSTELLGTPDVHIEAGSLFRDEAQDRDMKIMQLMEAGLIEKDEALDELSFRTGNRRISEKVQSMAHARDMLNVILGGGMIEIFANDDIDSFKQIFSEFMKTAQFYEIPPEKQNYIRDVLVSIATAGAPFEDYINAMNTAKVFPRATAPEGGRANVAANVTSPSSGQGQAQVRQAQAAESSRAGSMASAEHQLTNRSEAQIGSRRSGPG